MTDKKNRKAIRFLGKSIEFEDARKFDTRVNGENIRLDSIGGEWCAVQNGRLDAVVDAFRDVFAHASTPQAAASELERDLHRKFRALAKVLGYEVTG